MLYQVFVIFFAAFAFAELIDNALAATVDNKGPRKIEVSLVWHLVLMIM